MTFMKWLLPFSSTTSPAATSPAATSPAPTSVSSVSGSSDQEDIQISKRNFAVMMGMVHDMLDQRKQEQEWQSEW